MFSEKDFPPLSPQVAHLARAETQLTQEQALFSQTANEAGQSPKKPPVLVNKKTNEDCVEPANAHPQKKQLASSPAKDPTPLKKGTVTARIDLLPTQVRESLTPDTKMLHNMNFALSQELVTGEILVPKFPKECLLSADEEIEKIVAETPRAAADTPAAETPMPRASEEHRLQLERRESLESHLGLEDFGTSLTETPTHKIVPRPQGTEGTLKSAPIAEDETGEDTPMAGLSEPGESELNSSMESVEILKVGEGKEDKVEVVKVVSGGKKTSKKTKSKKKVDVDPFMCLKGLGNNPVKRKSAAVTVDGRKREGLAEKPNTPSVPRDVEPLPRKQWIVRSGLAPEEDTKKTKKGEKAIIKDEDAATREAAIESVCGFLAGEPRAKLKKALRERPDVVPILLGCDCQTQRACVLDCLLTAVEKKKKRDDIKASQEGGEKGSRWRQGNRQHQGNRWRQWQPRQRQQQG